MTKGRISYVGEDAGMVVSIVGEWRRGDLTKVMSAGSGPKDYTKNQICQAFSVNPEVKRIRMLVGEYQRSVPFCILQVGGAWYDCGRADRPSREVQFVADSGGAEA